MVEVVSLGLDIKAIAMNYESCIMNFQIVDSQAFSFCEFICMYKYTIYIIMCETLYYIHSFMVISKLISLIP